MQLINKWELVHTSGMNGPVPIYNYTEVMEMPAWESRILKRISNEIVKGNNETQEKPK